MGPTQDGSISLVATDNVEDSEGDKEAEYEDDVTTTQIDNGAVDAKSVSEEDSSLMIALVVVAVLALCVLGLTLYIYKMRKDRVLKREVSFDKKVDNGRGTREVNVRRQEREGVMSQEHGNSSNVVGMANDDTDEQSLSLHLDDTPGDDGMAVNDDEFVIDGADDMMAATPIGMVAIADGETDPEADDIDDVENLEDCDVDVLDQVMATPVMPSLELVKDVSAMTADF